jgi:antitoxin (DNA-binding transcriptional repressor) of toxin-antitoxin stability system
MRYTITVGGTTVAELAADAQSSTASITCNGTTTAVAANADCFQLPWTSGATCAQNACDFGALPAGSAAATTN